MAIESTDAISVVTETTLILTSVDGPSIVKEPASVAILLNHAERLEKFTGQNFKHWQQKMFFYLTTLNLVRFLTENAPKPKEGETRDGRKARPDRTWYIRSEFA